MEPKMLVNYLIWTAASAFMVVRASRAGVISWETWGEIRRSDSPVRYWISVATVAFIFAPSVYGAGMHAIAILHDI
jgi:hypothetical protein